MIRLATTALAAAFLLLSPVVSQAALSTYNQDFEGLTQSDPGALSGNGWLVFGNVFSPDHSAYYYGYGPFPAPNGGPGFCGIANNQGGAEQGTQQLVVYSDYNNGDHNNGNLIEANVFQERTIDVADVGTTWFFQFDAKLGDLISPSTALAFIKTLDPNNGYATTNFITIDMTSIPTTWGNYWISIAITPPLAGQILQFGFSNTTTHYVPSGIFYDNVAFYPNQPTPVNSTTWGRLKSLYR